MNFLLEFGDETKFIINKINYRRACKAVIYNEKGQLIMLKTGDGVFKFPGGGAKAGENDLQTLQREIREELGIEEISIQDTLGIVLEKKRDSYDKDCYFIMESVYYYCTVNSTRICATDLDEYEKKEGFHMSATSIEDAIDENERKMQEGLARDWTLRETMVLKALRCD